MNKEVVYLYASEHEKDHFTNIITVETTRLLLEGVDSLPTEWSKVFKLLYLEGKTIKEVAKELNLSLSTVKTQKARGLTAMRRKFPLLQIFLFSTFIIINLVI